MWSVALLLHKLPWDAQIADAPEEWLEWVLTMHRLYPDPLVFEPPEELAGRTAQQKAHVGMANVLIGRALERFMNRFTPKLKKRDRITRL